MKKLLRNHGLSLVIFAFFFLFWGGQAWFGYQEYLDQQKDHHQNPITITEYFQTGHFKEATFENWESEFLQMGVYVILTGFLYQKGSAESKDPDQKEEKTPVTSKSPAAVRRGGWRLKIYRHSLSLAFFFLFLISFWLHAVGGAEEYNNEQKEHGKPEISTVEFMKTSAFWFQSFQNWQSEFLAVGSIVVLSIFLREKGSAQSKPVEAPHSQTGS